VLLTDCTDDAAEICDENIQQSIAEISIYYLGQPFGGLLFLNSFSAAHLICAPLYWVEPASTLKYRRL
jgi:hypothetical protein